MDMPHIRNYPGKRIHLIGIGGSSMSGLAEMLMDQGYQVTGSDRDNGYLLDNLRKKGCPVAVGHRAENVHGADLVIYSAAISPENPERAEAKRLGIPSLERAYLLGQMMEGFPKAVGVCGAHGKTTVTSMLSQILMDSGMDPSIHIGGRLDAIGGSTRVGHSDIFISEACEFNRSFLHMPPTMAVVLNIDEDHLDCYRDIDEIEETFGMYLAMLPENGIAIGNGDDFRVRRQISRLGCTKVFYGMEEKQGWHPENWQESEDGYASFDLYDGDKFQTAVKMNVPGSFNAMNAMAAIAAAVLLGADPEAAAASIARFSGAHRRFERTDVIDGVEIFHDYGHNPTEMRNAISIARKRCRNGRVWAVMQPHTFSRVRTLFNEYLDCTREADITLVTDICAAREKDPGNLNSGMLVEGMKAHGIDAHWTPSFDDTEQWLRENWKPGDLVITLGCGDINRLNDQIHEHEIAGRAPADAGIPRNIRTIDTGAIRENMQLLRSATPKSAKMLAVVKADAYGHGAVQTAKAALAGGAEMLAVAAVSEGRKLREGGIEAPILVLGPVTRHDVEEGVEYGLIQTVCTPDMVALCQEACEKTGKQTKVHLKVDTGMGRIGVREREEMDRVLEALKHAGAVHLDGVFTHFADADGDEDGIAYTRRQFERFRQMTDGLPPEVVRHCANSAAIHRMPEMAMDMVRAGISLYGYPPVETDLPLKQCMEWRCKVSFIKELPAGEPISYGRTFRTAGPMKIATLTCGYGDGYHRAASGKAEVMIRGHRVRTVGRICMDQMMADITGFDDIQPGDPVILIGSDGQETIGADDIARWAGTISYEVLLSAGSRVEREFK